MASLVQSIATAASTASTAEVVIVTAISVSLALLLYVLQRCDLQLESSLLPTRLVMFTTVVDWATTNSLQQQRAPVTKLYSRYEHMLHLDVGCDPQSGGLASPMFLSN